MKLYLGQFDAGIKYKQHAIEMLTISLLFVDLVRHSLWFCYLEFEAISEGCRTEKVGCFES